jgi:predicted GH43/DUF377 family glycosyl hydrolase
MSKKFQWKKEGCIYVPRGLHGFDVSHCHKPTPLQINSETVRIYFGTRDQQSKTRTTFIDVDANNPQKIQYIHDKPVLNLGKIGAFDDSGANVSCVMRVDEKIYMYFIGWNPSTTVHTRNSIGLAISKDGGTTFERAYDGAVIDRSKDEPYYIGAVEVMHHNGKFMMWYTCGSEWKLINNKPEIFYHIKFAHSSNGIDWIRNNQTCIPPLHEFEATARPSVLFRDGKFHMWYSKRDLREFRVNPRFGYRGGYGVSDDGITWERMDEDFGLDISQDGNWDSDAIAYPYFLATENQDFLFYNGNGFGKTGMGFAKGVS